MRSRASIVLPKNALWLDAYVTELTTFPEGKFDDQVDSTAQALGWITMNGLRDGMLVYMQQEVEKMRRGSQ